MACDNVPQKAFPLPAMNSDFSEPPLPPPPAWEDIFGNAHPVEVEIGPGKGAFLLAAAQSAPEHNFFGIEFSRRRVYRIKELIEREQPDNVLALAADIGCVLNTPDSARIRDHLSSLLPGPVVEAAASTPASVSG